MPWSSQKLVVVPVDFSEGSVEAVRTALEISATPSGVHVVHVLLPLDTLSPGVIWGQMDEQSRIESAKTYLAEFVTKHGLGGVTPVVCLGDPGWEIAEYAKECTAGLIVIPSHGYHGMKRFVLGSVAERVIRHASCAVLVLRRPDAE